MNFKQLECFVKLSETLNFSETANELYMTQPAVTHSIRNLEEELGMPLFVRNKRNVVLTSSGISFYKDAKDILTKTNIAIAKAKKAAKEINPTISIGYYGTFFEFEYLSSVIREFHTRFPNAQLYLHKSDILNKKEELLSNKLDVLFTHSHNCQNYSNIMFQPLLKGYYACIMAKECELAGETKIHVAQLKEVSLIFLNPVQCTPEISELYNEILTSLSCPGLHINYADSPMDGYLMVKAGLGIAVMPNFVFEGNYDVQIIPLEIPEQLTFGIACLKNDTRKEIREFIKCAEECIAGYSLKQM